MNATAKIASCMDCGAQFTNNGQIITHIWNDSTHRIQRMGNGPVVVAAGGDQYWSFLSDYSTQDSGGAIDVDTP